MEQPNQIVATVNGKEITRKELDFQIRQLSSNPQVQVPEESGAEKWPQFEQAVIDQLVNDILIFEEAQKKDISADEKAIEAQVESVAGQFDNEEAFTNALTSTGLTKELLKKSIEHQLVLEQYYTTLIEENNISASEEEMKELYEQHIAKQENAPSFEDAKPQIKSHVEGQKLQKVLGEILTKAREEADIKIED